MLVPHCRRIRNIGRARDRRNTGDRLWRAAFVAGLIAGAGAYALARRPWPNRIDFASSVMVGEALMVFARA